MAVDGGLCASTNCIHLPVSVVIVHHMEIPMSTPWHPLNETSSKMVVSNGYLHLLVSYIRVTVSQQHDLIVMGEVIVGYGDGSGSHDSIDKPICTTGE